MSGRGLNVLNLDFVRDPGKLVDVALGKDEATCRDIILHAHVGWTVFFADEERLAAAERLLKLLPGRGLGHLVREAKENADKVREALAADPGARRVTDGGGGR